MIGSKRIVITGMGIVAPNGVGLRNFSKALFAGESGIRFIPKLQELNFGCQVGGIPALSQEQIEAYFTPLQLRNFKSDGIIYGCIAGQDAWTDAGLTVSDLKTDYDSGVVFGTGTSGLEKLKEAFSLIDHGKVKRLGSTAVIQTMASGVSAYLSGILGLGNQVTTNSSACSTGAEAILIGYERIKLGKAVRMLVGSTCEHGAYLWGGFDAMRVTNHKHNDAPNKASRPMSASAAGLVPGSGAGALVLETLESALSRGAPIYAELIGGAVNSGGQRNGGTLTAPNSEAVQRCIKQALKEAAITPQEIDLINGHLTATAKDAVEIQNWVTALDLNRNDFPLIQGTKSLVGHCFSASGAIESVATVLQIKEATVHPSINSEDLHADIVSLIGTNKVPQQAVQKDIQVAVKASFGFGDVNACVVFKKYKP